ncbi:hypothetical protein Tco_1176590 [Tanacetum coccineum]
MDWIQLLVNNWSRISDSANRYTSNITIKGLDPKERELMLGFVAGKNCKRGVRHADNIIESLPSDAWNTVPASSKRLKDKVYYILRCERAE